MREFEPARNFTEKVMQDIRAYEKSRTAVFMRSRLFLSSPAARCAVSAAGILAAIANVVRIAMTVFSPAVCR